MVIFTEEILEMVDIMGKEGTNGQMDPLTRVNLEMGNAQELDFGGLKKLVETFIMVNLD